MPRPPSGRRLTAVVTALALAACAGSGTQRGDAPRRTVLLTEQDDVRAGRDAAREVAAEIGVVDDPDLAAYVDGIGRRLLRGVPRRPFAFRFEVVDQVEPNAFAVPGGSVFVSRGLLVLANSEDELACVMGHEIVHVVRRHAAAQQAIGRMGTPLASPILRAGQMASYGRDMERQADEEGQLLCAAAGYDPRALGSFLQTLQQAERLRAGYSRTPGFFDTHPGSTERAAAASVRANEIRAPRDAAHGDTRAALLRHLDGLAVGDRPEAGIFEGTLFVQPDLGFQIRFPSGWRTRNTPRMAGAMEPGGAALVYVTADQPAGPPRQMAETWVVEALKQERLEVGESKPVRIGALDAWRMSVVASTRGGSLASDLTFVPFGGATYRITGVARARFAERHLGRTRATARSFAPLPEATRRAIRVTRLRVATARAGEDVAALSRRTGNAWDPTETALYNGWLPGHRLAGGELVKVAQSEPYAPQPR